eukprot:GFYU01000373.1.p1 GENE.GFYU01000373.1~~GFYU01000373.1.p1  ORF type:complete len:733 (-),score=291.21 GFYU01000373.1:191-2323(-)
MLNLIGLGLLVGVPLWLYFQKLAGKKDTGSVVFGKVDTLNDGTILVRPQNLSDLCDYDKRAKHSVIKPDGEMEILRSKTGVASLEPTTVMTVFKRATEASSNQPALKWEENGVWKQYTWLEYYNQVMTCARAFVALGLKPFQSVNIIGFNSREWFIANMGAIAAGGKAAGIYTTNGTDACKYITEHSEAAIVVVEDKDQLDKYIQIRDQLPLLQAIIMYRGEVPAGVNVSGKVPVYSWEEFMGKADSVPQSKIDQLIAAQRPGHCCTLIYTSGTTGPPKAVMISHDNLTWVARSMMGMLPDFGEGQEHCVSYLPLSHIAAQLADIHLPMSFTAFKPGCATVWFARPDALKGTLGETLKAVRPTLFFGVPRVWEKIEEKMKAIGAKTTGVLKTVSTWAKSQGHDAFVHEQTGEDGEKNMMFAVANGVILNKVKKAMGLDRCRLCLTGAAPITKDTLNYFGSLFVTINELYGMSECTGPQCVSVHGARRIGSCGHIIPSAEMKLEHVKGRDREGEGEICYRGRHVMMGYMKNEAKTRESIDEDGWLHSGDVGRVDEYGLLYITGRIKELIITAGGENVAPVPVEDAIKSNCPGLSNVMMVGDKRKYNVALVTLKTKQLDDGSFSDQLIGEATSVGTATTVSEAKQDKSWETYITNGIAAYNKTAVSNAAKVQKFRILDTDFSVNGGELTATMKLRREIVSQKYASVIDGLYA